MAAGRTRHLVDRLLTCLGVMQRGMLARLAATINARQAAGMGGVGTEGAGPMTIITDDNCTVSRDAGHVRGLASPLTCPRSCNLAGV